MAGSDVAPVNDNDDAHNEEGTMANDWVVTAYAYGEAPEHVGVFQSKKFAVEQLEIFMGEQAEQTHKYGAGYYEFNHQHVIERKV